MPAKRRRIIEDDDDEEGDESAAGPSTSPTRLAGQSPASSASSALTPPPISPQKSKTAKTASQPKRKSMAGTSTASVVEESTDTPRQPVKLTLKLGKQAAPPSELVEPAIQESTAPTPTAKQPRPAKRKSIVSERTIITRSQSPEKQGSRSTSPSRPPPTPTEPVASRPAAEAKGAVKTKGKGKSKEKGVAEIKESDDRGKSKSTRSEVVEDKPQESPMEGDLDLFGDPTDPVESLHPPPDPSPAPTNESSKVEKKKKSGIFKGAAADAIASSSAAPGDSSAAAEKPTKTSGLADLKKRRLSSSGKIAKSSPLASRPGISSPQIPSLGTPGPLDTKPPVAGSTDPKKPAAAIQPKKSFPNLKKKLPSGTPSRAPSATTSLLSSTLASLTKAPAVATPPGKKEEKKNTPAPPPKKKGAWDEVWVLTPEEEAAYEAALPQREAEKAARAQWKINPINLQEGKDAYRLEMIQPRAINIPHSDRLPDVHGLVSNGATSRMIAALLAGKSG